MSVCLICLIGLPATGKSTLLNHLTTRFSIHGLSHFYERVNVIPVVYDDEIDWSDIQDETKWKDKRRSVYMKVESIFERLLQEKEVPDSKIASLIILDDNMYYRSMRYEYYKLAKKSKCSYCQIYLSSTKEKALQANVCRQNRVPDHIIERMAEKLEIPNKDKFAWEERTLVVNNYEVDSVETIVNFIYEALRNPLQMEVENVVKNYTQNDIHIADLALRKIVKSEIEKGIILKSNLSQLASDLSKKRLKTLSDIKSGFIELPEVNSEPSQAIEQYTEFLLPFMAG